MVHGLEIIRRENLKAIAEHARSRGEPVHIDKGDALGAVTMGLPCILDASKIEAKFYPVVAITVDMFTPVSGDIERYIEDQGIHYWGLTPAGDDLTHVVGYKRK